jgi:3-hydroxyisobutyrate dehydrogenase-like beta-hydroxyacid dehydrogenase
MTLEVQSISPLPAIGILYAGEMGASLGRVFKSDGLRVLTTCDGRSLQTQRRCEEFGLEVLSFGEVVRQANIVVSAVPPSAALEVAKQYAAAAQTAPAGSVYVDVNAVSPLTAGEIADFLNAAAVSYVDGAINGLASALQGGAILYLSGRHAGEIGRLIGRSLKVQVIGDQPGKSKALKGALAGLSKGLTALFVEIDGMARAAGLSQLFVERCRSYYPGIMEVVDRMLPTYSQHARRRSEELQELEQAMLAWQVEPRMVRAARAVTQDIADRLVSDRVAR